MEKKLYSVDGEEIGSIHLVDHVFGVDVNTGLIHRLLVMELANRRQGNAATKRRGEVRGSTAKPWRQKGTGRARAGHKRSPIWRGGGVVFGPQPRSYRQSMPKKMKRKAYMSLLSLRAMDDGITRVVQDFSVISGKTRDLVPSLSHFAQVKKDRIVLVIGDHSEQSRMIRRAGANIPNLKILSYSRLEAHSFFYAKKILFMESAIRGLNTFYNDGARAQQD